MERKWANDAAFCGESKNSDGIGILINSNFSFTIQTYKEIAGLRTDYK